MNADRLLQFAKDFLEEYKQFNIAKLAKEVIQLCTQRPTATTPQFVASSQNFQAQAEQIIQNTRFRKYPRSYIDLIENTPYINAMPSRVAEQIIKGLTSDVATTMSANECQALLGYANATFHELGALVATLEKLGVEPVTTKGEQISIEFNLPRLSFGNIVSDYLLWRSAR